MKVSHLIILVTAILLGGTGYLAVSAYRGISTTVSNSYAVWWVGGMVVEYMHENDDRWPQSWDDLRPVYDQSVTKGNQPWTFDELKSRVGVRWDVDVEKVRELPAPPRDLIFLRDGGREHVAGQEPNEMVHQYLTQQPPANQQLHLTGNAPE